MTKKLGDDNLELRLSTRDFERFRPELQKNPEYNAERLEVRRKLEGIGKHLVKTLSAKGVALTSRASLHHPYKFNRFRVDSQWVYLSRDPKARKAIQRILGVDLGKDLDQNYVHVLLVLEVHEHGLEIALRVHKGAWWDGENLKRKTVAQEAREQFAATLHGVPAFGLRIHDFRTVHACESITSGEIQQTLKYYTPGEHWLHIARAVSRDDPLVSDPAFLERVTEEFCALLPVYRYIAWGPKNNHLFA